MKLKELLLEDEYYPKREGELSSPMSGIKYPSSKQKTSTQKSWRDIKGKKLLGKIGNRYKLYFQPNPYKESYVVLQSSQDQILLTKQDVTDLVNELSKIKFIPKSGYK